MSISTSLTALQTAKTDIAAAITAKGGTVNGGDGFSSFPARIAAIPSGGSTPTQKKDINFYDYDGAFVVGYSLSDLPLTELPTPPDHSGDVVPLTFQEWNYTLAQVNALTQKQDVGACYVPTDGKTHFLYTITTVTGGSPTLTINNTGGGTLTVDWGDGSAPQTASGAGNKTFTPAVEIANGSYDLTVSSDKAYAMPALTYSTYIFGSRVYNSCITSAMIGVQATALGGYAFNACQNLKNITVSAGVEGRTERAFQNCYSLKHITLPKGITYLDGYNFYRCFNLSSFSLPRLTHTGLNSDFMYCISLTSVTIPPSASTMYASNFSGCCFLLEVELPFGLTGLKEYVFNGCFCMRSIKIPATVTTIQQYCFGECYSLTSYDFSQHTSVPTLSNINAFSGINSICQIKVPLALLDTWRAATNWATYANYIVGV